jgi:hypothetical protein
VKRLKKFTAKTLLGEIIAGDSTSKDYGNKIKQLLVINLVPTLNQNL